MVMHTTSQKSEWNELQHWDNSKNVEGVAPNIFRFEHENKTLSYSQSIKCLKEYIGLFVWSFVTVKRKINTMLIIR